MSQAENDAILNKMIEGIILATTQDGVDDIDDYQSQHRAREDLNTLHPLVLLPPI